MAHVHFHHFTTAAFSPTPLSQLKIALFVGSRYCLNEGRAAQERPSLGCCTLLENPWSKILKEIAPDSFSINSLLSFPTGPLGLCNACDNFQHGEVGIEGATRFGSSRRGRDYCATMLSSSITSSSNCYSIWLFCLLLCCSATHTHASDGKIIVNFKISNILNTASSFW